MLGWVTFLALDFQCTLTLNIAGAFGWMRDEPYIFNQPRGIAFDGDKCRPMCLYMFTFWEEKYDQKSSNSHDVCFLWLHIAFDQLEHEATPKFSQWWQHQVISFSSLYSHGILPLVVLRQSWYIFMSMLC